MALIFQTRTRMTTSPDRTTRPSLPRLPRLPRLRLPVLALLLLVVLAGCRIDDEPQAVRRANAAQAERSSAGSDLQTVLEAAVALADSVHELLRPVALMTTADEESLRRYSNAENVRIARQLGVHPSSEAELRAALDDGRLIRLEDSTEHWVLRPNINPYVTPDAYALLERLGESFQARLEAMGLPPYRYEISSVLRSPEAQAALRRSNPNAAAGTSSHEFGTTVDIVYEAYPAPAELPEGLLPGDLRDRASPEEAAALELVARTVLERMAARKSRELQAIMGQVMRDHQARGEVLVTLERQQPVYHITVAKALR
jgi:hypothetical protein